MKRGGATSSRASRSHLSTLAACAEENTDDHRQVGGREESMGLTLRPAGLGSAADKERRNYTVFSGEFVVGRIYEERGAPADLQWFWAITGIFGTPAHMRLDGHAPTLEAAKAALGETWRTWLGWAKLTEIGGKT
jgi:hypothetical protein